MRIIAGEFRGRKLKAIRGMTTRPTSDKVKGAIFNILGPRVIQTKVLDLFAGTGSLALEAISRGALKAVLVEQDSSAWNTIRDNMSFLKDENKIFLFRSDAFSFLKQHGGEKFDLIFLDPPYYKGLAEKAINDLYQGSFLEPSGIIVVETAADETLDSLPEMLEIRIEREYGDTKIWFIQEKI